jgi:hypothetical protein
LFIGLKRRPASHLGKVLIIDSLLASTLRRLPSLPLAGGPFK